MSFDVSGLSNYVNQESTRLISRVYFENTSADYFQKQVGIKTSEALQIFAISAVPQADSSCGFTASGSATFTQRNLTVGAIKYQDTLCPKTLRAKWTQRLLTAGTGENEQLTFEAYIAEQLLNLIREHVEVLDWQGDTASTNEYLNKYDGLIKLIDAGSPVAGNSGSVAAGTGFTSSNAVAIMNAMANARPAKMRNKACILFMPTEWFDIYIDALNASASLSYNIDVTGDNGYVYRVPGKNVKVVGVHGLDGTNRMFLSHEANLFLGVDMMNEEEIFDLWYSKDDRNVKYEVAFKRGVQVAFTNEVVQFTFA